MTDPYQTGTLETKVAGTAPPHDEVNAALGQLLKSFEDFKIANDERLDQIERRISVDIVTADKVERINAALDEHKRAVDELALKAVRPQLAGPAGALLPPLVHEHREAFHDYVRKGETHGLVALEAKALSSAVSADGGYLVPEETEAEIGRLLHAASPIRAISGVRQVSAAVYKKPFAITGAATGWVGETASRSETDAPTLAELQFPAMELYAMPAATQTLLDDAVVNIDQWIAEEVQTAFAEQETTAFVTGDGDAKPKGFLDYDTVEDSSWEWEKLGYIATGVDGALPADDPSDLLIDLVYALKAGYRQNAHWVMNRRSQAALRKLKDGDGNYIWHPSTRPGERASLMGFPVSEVEAMPDIGPDNLAVAFGDFSRGYLIVDRLGVRILRDPYSNKPYVLFYTTKRVGGGIQNFEAIKLLKFGES